MPDRQSMLDDLLRDALTHDPAERTAFVARLRGSDPTLADELTVSLELLETRGDFLEEPPIVDLREIESLEPDAVDQETPASLDPLAVELPFDIGSYTLLEHLGSGGASAVYRARQHLPNREVAVKLITPPGSGSTLGRALREEADALARLRHPAIAQIHEARIIETQGSPVALLAMELVDDAQRFDAFLSSRPPARRERVELVAQVADALHHAHQKGVIHRDVKPANILVDGRGSPKVIDFGIAAIRDANRAEHDDTVRGSWRYMSPEHLAGAAATDIRSDVYSLGVVLYETLAGQAPYGRSPADLPAFIDALRHETPAPLDGAVADADLEAVVRRCLHKDPDRRYESMAALAADLRRWLGHQPVTARPTGIVHAARLLARRRPLMVTVSALAVLLIMAASVVTLGLYLRSERLRSDLLAAQAEQRQQAEIARAARVELDGLQSLLARALRQGRSDADEVEYRSGLGTVSFDFVETLGESVDAARTNDEKGQVIDAAVATLRRIEREAGDDPELQQTIAETYIQLGDLNGRGWLASAEEAATGEQPYRQAIQLWSRLVERDPTDTRANAGLSHASARLAQTLRKLDRDREALARSDDAIAAAGRLLRLTNGALESRLAMVAALWARGDACIGAGPAELGLADSEESVRLLEPFAESASPGVIGMLAWSHYRVAVWHWKQFEDPRSALPHAVRANDLHLDAIRRDPGGHGSVESLIEQCWPEIDLLRSMGAEGRALDRTVEILDEVGRALRASQHRRELVEGYAATRMDLVDQLRAAGRIDAARVRAVELAEWLGWSERAEAGVVREALLKAAELCLDEQPATARRLLERAVALPAASPDALLPDTAARIDALERALRRLGR